MPTKNPTDDQYRDAAVLLPAYAVGHKAKVERDTLDGDAGAHVEAIIRAKGVYIDVLVWIPEESAANIRENGNG